MIVQSCRLVLCVLVSASASVFAQQQQGGGYA